MAVYYPPAAGDVNEQVSAGHDGGVKKELAIRLARVVLSPWTDWDDGSGEASRFRHPQLVLSSTGAEDHQTVQPRTQHNPLEDDILFISPSLAPVFEKAREMGVGGTWPEICPIAQRGENRVELVGNRVELGEGSKYSLEGSEMSLEGNGFSIWRGVPGWLFLVFIRRGGCRLGRV